jgi:hypothetical protein
VAVSQSEEPRRGGLLDDVGIAFCLAMIVDGRIWSKSGRLVGCATKEFCPWGLLCLPFPPVAPIWPG